MAYAATSRFEELENANKELRAMLAVQAAQIERNTTTIYQLLGGLFNQRTQARILNVHMSGLFVQDGASACEAAHDEAAHDEAAVTSASEAAHDEDDEAADEDEELENVWPTTRQGDEHSERLKEMEERFRKLEEQVVAMEKRQLEKFGSTE